MKVPKCACLVEKCPHRDEVTGSCAGIPSRSPKRIVSNYSRSVASSSPPKRPQSARAPNGTATGRPASPALGSPSKQGETVPTNPTPTHRRARSWVPPWSSSKKEVAAGTLDDHGVAELAIDASEMQDVQDAEKSSKSKKGWHWWSRPKDSSAAAPATDDDEEIRDQGNAVAEASPVNAATSDAKACSRVSDVQRTALSSTPVVTTL